MCWCRRCIGPLVFALLGISGAAFARQFAPYRPYLLALTYGLLGAAFYLAYRPAKADCGAGEACEMPRANRAGIVLLWIAAVKVQLKKTEGVTAYEVSLESGEAAVSYDPAKTTPEKIAESVSKTGFKASVKKAGEAAG